MDRIRIFNVSSIIIITISFLSGLFYYFSNKTVINYKVISYQNQFHRDLVSSITDFSGSENFTTWFAVVFISFLYGVFHAIGPGHGKAIITTYLATHKENIKKGIIVSVASSLMQGITAIALVSVLVIGLGLITRQAMNNVTHLEAFSFSLVSILGLYIFIKGLLKTPFYKKLKSNKESSVVHDHHGCCGCSSHSKPDVKGDWKAIALTIISIGIRPCSGAVLILGASLLLGNFVIGLTAVLAMSIGTAIVVATIAVMTVFFRTRIEGLAGSYDKVEKISFVFNILIIFGGLFILILGLSMLHSVLTLDAVPARIF